MSGSEHPGQDMAAVVNAVRQLTDQVRLLIEVLDACLTELQWRNNQATDWRPSTPFILTSMPKDPAAKDWQINQVGPADVQPPVPRRSSTLFD